VACSIIESGLTISLCTCCLFNNAAGNLKHDSRVPNRDLNQQFTHLTTTWKKNRLCRLVLHLATSEFVSLERSHPIEQK